MKHTIRKYALDLGFDDCRFTTAQSPDHADEFQQWLASKRHGEMAWIERNAHKRVDPRQVLPGARSVIVLAASYHIANHPSSINNDEGRQGEGHRQSFPGRQHPASRAWRPEGHIRPPATGVIARYARYQDYHDVLAQRLRPLVRFVDRLGGAGSRSLWYVDAGPLLERDFGQRAGLGFIGKHTNLIGRQLGNWTFLAEIITTLELEPDAPERNHCGSCTRCLAVCPTAAITEPFQLDARRCISYLTIELKGPIPVELRPAIGNRIFGCDDCLAICPWNRFAREGGLMKPQARPDLGQPDLIELLSLDETSFRARFAGTPILRAKRRGLLRNVCVALGNIASMSALPELRKAATDCEPLVAEHASWAIEQVESRCSL